MKRKELVIIEQPSKKPTLDQWFISYLDPDSTKLVFILLLNQLDFVDTEVPPKKEEEQESEDDVEFKDDDRCSPSPLISLMLVSKSFAKVILTVLKENPSIFGTQLGYLLFYRPFLGFVKLAKMFDIFPSIHIPSWVGFSQEFKLERIKNALSIWPTFHGFEFFFDYQHEQLYDEISEKILPSMKGLEFLELRGNIGPNVKKNDLLSKLDVSKLKHLWIMLDFWYPISLPIFPNVTSCSLQRFSGLPNSFNGPDIENMCDYFPSLKELTLFTEFVFQIPESHGVNFGQAPWDITTFPKLEFVSSMVKSPYQNNFNLPAIIVPLDNNLIKRYEFLKPAHVKFSSKDNVPKVIDELILSYDICLDGGIELIKPKCVTLSVLELDLSAPLSKLSIWDTESCRKILNQVKIWGKESVSPFQFKLKDCKKSFDPISVQQLSDFILNEFAVTTTHIVSENSQDIIFTLNNKTDCS